MSVPIASKTPKTRSEKITTKEQRLQELQALTPAELKKKNAKFNALPPMKKRVAIAEEILLQIRMKQFIPGDGYGSTYEGPDARYGPLTSPFPYGDIQQSFINGITCIGCAKAGVIVARAALGDKVKRKDGVGVSNLAHKVSAEIFGKELANIIEALYESTGTYLRSKEKNEALDKYRAKLPNRYTNAAGRMKAIYKNIAKNKGFLVVGKFKF